jgi:hypothetical protein
MPRGCWKPRRARRRPISNELQIVTRSAGNKLQRGFPPRGAKVLDVVAPDHHIYDDHNYDDNPWPE